MSTFIPLQAIKISDSRQRKNFKPEAIAELAESIVTNELLHAPILDAEGNLVAGERRLRAIELLYSMGSTFSYNGERVPAGQVPHTTLTDPSEEKIYEAELVENIQRVNLSIQEEAEAIARLHEIRQSTNPTHTINATALEIAGSKSLGADRAPGSLRTKVKELVLIHQHKSDPRVAQAKTQKQAMRAVEKIAKEEHARKVAEEFTSKTSPTTKHFVHHQGMEELLDGYEDGIVDLFVTDPPYGIGAQDFGSQTSLTHKYDDSYESWKKMMTVFAAESYRVAAQQAHAYIFCDFARWHELGLLMAFDGWEVWPRPLFWHKGNAGMLPKPDYGPRYTYETILFASKGHKPVEIRGASDILIHPKKMLTRHAAEKPPSLYLDLIRRSTAPGSTVCDPFMGCGPILPAANSAHCSAIAGDLDATFYGMALQRMDEEVGDELDVVEEIEDLDSLFAEK